MSTADVEDLLAERGVIVGREAARLWVNRFGRHFANCVRHDRPRSNDKWHLDEVVTTIGGKKHWLWRAIDTTGEFLIFWAKHAATQRLQNGFSKVWLPALTNQEL